MSNRDAEQAEKERIAFISGSLMPFAMVLLIVVICAYEGAVLVPLWRWFVTETFGIRPLSLMQAIGLGLVFNMLFPGVYLEVKKEYRDNQDRLRSMLLKPFFSLAIGAVVHWFMHR